MNNMEMILMAAWSPLQRHTKQNARLKKIRPVQKTDEHIEEDKVTTIPTVTMNRFELSLRPGIKAIVLTPADLTLNEASKIKKYIEYLESVSK